MENNKFSAEDSFRNGIYFTLGVLSVLIAVVIIIAGINTFFNKFLFDSSPLNNFGIPVSIVEWRQAAQSNVQPNQ